MNFQKFKLPALSTKLSLKEIDIVFAQDLHKNGDNSSNESSHFIEKICQVVFGLSRGTLRIAHIAYKDREPSSKQPNISVIPLTTNRDAILRKVKALPDELDGGTSNAGDIGVLSALKASLDLEWRADAHKIIVLISNKESRKLSSDGLEVLRAFTQKGISLFVYKMGVQDLFATTEDKNLASKIPVDLPHDLKSVMFPGQLLDDAKGSASGLMSRLEQTVKSPISLDVGGAASLVDAKKELKPETSKANRAAEIEKMKTEMNVSSYDIINNLSSAILNSEESNEGGDSGSEEEWTPPDEDEDEEDSDVSFIPGMGYSEQKVSIELTRRIVLRALMAYTNNSEVE